MQKKTHLTVKDITVILQRAKLLKECRNNRNWSFLAAFEQIGVLGEWMKEWAVCQRRMESVGFPTWQPAVSEKYRCHTGVKCWKTQPSCHLSQLAPHLLWERGFSDHRSVWFVCLMWSASLLHLIFVTQITLIILCLAQSRDQTPSPALQADSLMLSHQGSLVWSGQNLEHLTHRNYVTGIHNRKEVLY